jgi:hypothetical protein
MSEIGSITGARFVAVTVIVKFLLSLEPAVVAVTDAGYGPVASPKLGLAVTVPVPFPLSVSEAKDGREAERVMASPSGSDAETFRFADVPCATDRLAMGANTTGRSVFETLIDKLSESEEQAGLADTDEG